MGSQDGYSEHGVQFVRKLDGRGAFVDALIRAGLVKTERSPLAFIVHGHDEPSLAELKDYLQNTLKWQPPTVLREQPNSGRTIIEKFEEYGSRADCVFVLLTPDDEARSADGNDVKRQSRQNVIFELGFFYGQMGRRSGRVIVLYKGGLEIPSDLHGIVWINIEHGVRAAGEDIRNELAQLRND